MFLLYRDCKAYWVIWEFVIWELGYINNILFDRIWCEAAKKTKYNKNDTGVCYNVQILIYNNL